MMTMLIWLLLFGAGSSMLHVSAYPHDSRERDIVWVDRFQGVHFRKPVQSQFAPIGSRIGSGHDAFHGSSEHKPVVSPFKAKGERALIDDQFSGAVGRAHIDYNKRDYRTRPIVFDPIPDLIQQDRPFVSTRDRSLPSAGVKNNDYKEETMHYVAPPSVTNQIDEGTLNYAAPQPSEKQQKKVAAAFPEELQYSDSVLPKYAILSDSDKEGVKLQFYPIVEDSTEEPFVHHEFVPRGVAQDKVSAVAIKNKDFKHYTLVDANEQLKGSEDNEVVQHFPFVDDVEDARLRFYPIVISSEDKKKTFVHHEFPQMNDADNKASNAGIANEELKHFALVIPEKDSSIAQTTAPCQHQDQALKTDVIQAAQQQALIAQSNVPAVFSQKQIENQQIATPEYTPVPKTIQPELEASTFDSRCYGLAEGAKIASGSCRRHYIQCTKGKAELTSCSLPEEVFSERLNGCIPKASALECRSSRSKALASFYRRTHKAVGPMDESTFCKERPDGFYRHPEECSRIVQCFGHEIFEYPSCDNNLAFDEEKSVCNYRNLVPGCSKST